MNNRNHLVSSKSHQRLVSVPTPPLTRTIEVPGPLVKREEFVAFEPRYVKVVEEGRRYVWNYVVGRVAVYLAGVQDTSFVRMRFGGQVPKNTHVQFGQVPDENAISHAGREQFDYLSVPTLRKWVDSINQRLSPEAPPEANQQVVDAELGGGVGVVVLKHLDEAATHFGCPSVLDLPVQNQAAAAEQQSVA